MIRLLSALVILGTVVGCSGRPTESGPEARQLTAVTADAFMGTWRSVTPSTEFIRLTVNPLSREQGMFGARLTFSGVMWEGSGRVDGDALVTSMTMIGASSPTGQMTARLRDGTLSVTLKSPGATTNLSFVREN